MSVSAAPAATLGGPLSANSLASAYAFTAEPPRRGRAGLGLRPDARAFLDGTRRFAQQITPDPGGSALTSGLGGRPSGLDGSTSAHIRALIRIIRRQDVVHDQRGRLGHPPSAAARTEAAALAAERNQLLSLTRLALDPQKPVLESATLQIRLKLVLDIARQRPLLGRTPIPELRI